MVLVPGDLKDTIYFAKIGLGYLIALPRQCHGKIKIVYLLFAKDLYLINRKTSNMYGRSSHTLKLFCI